jgi:hypothetical protein
MHLRTCASCLAGPALFAVLSLVGCGSSGAGSSAASDAIPTADNGLAGTYVADDTTSADGNVLSITFVDDTRYLLQPTTCPDANDCREQGWYTVAGDELALHDDLGDAVQTFSLAVLSSGSVPVSTASADDGADAGDGSSGDAVALGTASLVRSGGGSLYYSNQVFALSLGRSRYHLVNSEGALVNAANVSTLVTPASTSTSSAGTTVGSSILFEGSCSFLHSCSSFSEKLPAGEVSWGCVGVKTCSDTDHWLAGPSSAYCGKTVTVCKGTTCTTGTVLDVSSAGKWEGSEGLLGAVGLPYGLTGTCSGYGGGTVTIKD